MQLLDITEEYYDEAIPLLAQTFGHAPLMRYLFSDRPDDYERLVLEFFRFALRAGLAMDNSIKGCLADTKLIGIAIFGWSQEENKPRSAVLSQAVADFKSLIGPEAANRYEKYAKVATRPHPPALHCYLSVLGIHPEFRGKGYGRILLDELHQVAGQYSGSAGICLDTANPANVAFYEHFGYKIIEKSGCDDLEIWCMFRSNI